MFYIHILWTIMHPLYDCNETIQNHIYLSSIYIKNRVLIFLLFFMLPLDLCFIVDIILVPWSWSLCKFECMQEVANLCMEKLDPMQPEANVLLSKKTSSNDRPLLWMIYQLYEVVIIHKIHWIMIISNLQLLELFHRLVHSGETTITQIPIISSSNTWLYLSNSYVFLKYSQV